MNLDIAEKYFLKSKFASVVIEANSLYACGMDYHAEELLNKLPDEKAMLAALVEKLKGKSVWKGLKNLEETQNQGLEALIAWSSLHTHCLLEMKESPEYLLLADQVLETINRLRFGGVL